MEENVLQIICETAPQSDKHSRVDQVQVKFETLSNYGVMVSWRATELWLPRVLAIISNFVFVYFSQVFAVFSSNPLFFKIQVFCLSFCFCFKAQMLNCVPFLLQYPPSKQYIHYSTRHRKQHTHFSPLIYFSNLGFYQSSLYFY